MLMCTRCRRMKIADDFSPKKRGEPALQGWCRACFAEVGAKHYADNRQRERERIRRSRQAREADLRRRSIGVLEERACVDCGEQRPDLLVFEQAAQRPRTMSELVHSGWSWQKVAGSLGNCDVRCRGCRHRRAAPDGPRAVVRPRMRTPSYASLADTLEGRVCARCGRRKSLEDFAPKYRELPRPSSYCRSCQCDYHKEWYQRKREDVLARVRADRARPTERESRNIIYLDARRQRWHYLLAHPCVDCGENDPIVLEFDHRSGKRAGINELMRRSIEWSEIRAEIEACDVRCANCHRRRTALTRGYYRDLLDPALRITSVGARRRRWEYLLAHPCVDCGEEDPVVLEFDHRAGKRAAIVDLMRSHASWEDVLAEIQKCDVRCANCHRRRTARARGHYREFTRANETALRETDGPRLRATPDGHDPSTSSFVGKRSIQLSYGVSGAIVAN